MEINSNLELLFEKIKEFSSHSDAKVYGTDYWKICHKLADAQYYPAKMFFIEKLDDPRKDWRKVSISLLGFHYQLEPNTIEKIRQLLRYDPDASVRMDSAGVLGVKGLFPEKVLADALEFDSDAFVREAAFSAILELAKVPYKTRIKENKNIREGKISANLDQVKRILYDEKMLKEVSQLSNIL